MYSHTVVALNTAADRFIPKLKVNALKFWWDNELDPLKAKAMGSHKMWVENGRPRNGSIYDIKKHDKYCYKASIERRKTQSKETVSNDLHDSFLNKNSGAFWKMWKHKVCDSTQSLPCIDDCNDIGITTEKFKDYFSKVCTVIFYGARC